MAFPNTPLDLRVELYLGVLLGWVDITDDVYTPREPVTITRGRQDEAAAVDPGKCSLILNNRHGRYSPRNPRSPYYGLLGRNTPIRVSVPGGESYLALDGTEDGIASTGGSLALGLSAELDVRVELTGDLHVLGQDRTLIGQHDGVSSDGWVLRLTGDGRVSLFVQGTTAQLGVTQPIPSTLPNRVALRATWKADDGTGLCEFEHYWAESLDGPWHLYSRLSLDPIGTLDDSALPIEIAPTYLSASGEPRSPMEGLVHRAEVRSAIDGPVLAAPDCRALAEGTDAFTDSAGLAWTLGGTAEVTDRAYRFHGEVSAWPTRWDTSGTDVYVPIQAAGVLRRMGQGAPTLQSTLRRRIPGGADGQPEPTAYWPMEEGQHATQAYSPLDGVAPLRTSGLNWGSDDTLFGSDALPTVSQSASIEGEPHPSRPQLGGWTVDMSYRLDKMPDTSETMMRARIGGVLMGAAECNVSTAGIELVIYDYEGTQLNAFTSTDADAIAAFASGLWNRMQMYSSTAGGQTYVSAYWRDVITGIAWHIVLPYDGGIGILTRVEADWGAGLSGMGVGHLGTWGIGGSTTLGPLDTAPGITYFDDADDGFEHETAWTRMNRLSYEEGVPIRAWTGEIPSELMGPQRVQSLLDLLEETAAADGGLLFEERHQPTLAFRSRSTLYNQDVRLALDYAAGDVAPPLEPTEDDQDVVNDEEVKRESGSSGHAVLLEGPLSIQPPPNGIGRVNESVTLNLAADSQTEPMAYWRMHLGTVDEARYPTVHIMLHAAPHLIPQALDLDVLDRMQILNPPEWQPPGTIELLANGYTEELGIYTWDISFNCSPGSPWIIGQAAVDPATAGTNGPNRADTSGSVLAADASEGDTELLVHTTDGPEWVTSAGAAVNHPDDFPLDVSVGGEVVRASAGEPMVWDGFSRTVVDGWGTADSGTAWNVTGGGGPPDFDVDGIRGTIHLAANQGLLRFAEIVEALGDAEILVSIAVDQLPAAGDYLAGCFFRAGTVDGATVLYWVNLALQADSQVGIEVRNGIAPVGMRVVTPLTYAPGTRLLLRARVDGHRLQGRVWIAGTYEPGNWTVDRTVTTGTVDTGTLGVVVAATEASTPLFMVDDVQVVTPQRFTVTRGINGLQMAHTAGADVRLAQPMIVAL